MQLYHTNEIRFLLPDRYVDRSITGFVIPGGEAGSPIDPEKSGEFSLVLTREAVPPGTSALNLIRRQIEVMEQSLPAKSNLPWRTTMRKMRIFGDWVSGILPLSFILTTVPY